MTEDGGVAESLNVQLNDSEIAPSFIPEDVTKKLGLPDDLQAERVFIHKTPNYENAIVVQDDRIVAYTPHVEDEEPLAIVELAEGEKVNDITSIGNTVIIMTTARPLYLLFKEMAYNFIGDHIPMPTIEFYDVETPIHGDSKYVTDGPLYTTGLNYPPSLIDESAIEAVKGRMYTRLYDGDEAAIGSEYSKIKYEFDANLWGELDINGRHKYNVATEILEDIKGLYDGMRQKSIEAGVLNNPVWAIYAVRLYDRSLKISTPFLLSGGIESPVDILALGGEYSTYAFYHIRLNHYYKIGVHLYDYLAEDIESWKDIIKGIDIYISEDINALDWKTLSVVERTGGTAEQGASFAKFQISGLKGSFIEHACSCTTFTKVAEFAIDKSFYPPGTDSVDAIRDDYTIDLGDKIKNENRLSGGIQLSDEVYDMSNSNYVGDLTQYNNSILIYNISERLNSGPTWLLSQRFNSLLPTPYVKDYTEYDVIYPTWWGNPLPIAANIPSVSYEITYMVRSKQGEEAVIYGKSNNGNYFSMQRYRYEIAPLAFLLIMYPHNDCYKVEVRTDGRTQSFAMKQHGYMPNLSIAYGGELYSEVSSGQVKEKPEEQRLIKSGNKLGQSKEDNPFLIESFHVFQSKILGVAVATAALSQGQFGQFPLYVFTEDGIWVMETAADGSFVTSKPLSRDVCVNPDSITPLDNAVVFVTAQGVMMLQGSQVVNISPNMNGRHYQIENSARTIIENQDFFCDLLSTISDKTHFLAFVKSASVAYDYAGKRLIFIKDDEAYQYVYKLDTQTWHKTAYGINLVAPINSYPECLVQAKRNVDIKTRKVLRVIQNISQEEREYLAERLRVKLPGLRDEVIDNFLDMTDIIDVTDLSQSDIDWIVDEMRSLNVIIQEEEQTETIENTRVYDLSTLLDAQESGIPARGIIATRPFDLGEPDILKTITDIRIRGQFPKGAVKFILLGSNDGINFATVSTLRGRAWKLFRMVILADLAPTERISWVDIMYDTKFTNKLR